MAGGKPQYSEPVFKLATKNSFFEVYDGLYMERPKMSISIMTHENNKMTNKVSFYFDIETFLGFCDSILSGAINALVPVDSDQNELHKGFPSINFGIPRSGEKMRKWTMFKSAKSGNFAISIQERQRKDDWDNNSPILGEAIFYLSPFKLISMASSCKSYLERKLLVQEISMLGQYSPNTGRAYSNDDFSIE